MCVHTQGLKLWSGVYKYTHPDWHIHIDHLAHTLQLHHTSWHTTHTSYNTHSIIFSEHDQSITDDMDLTEDV